LYNLPVGKKRRVLAPLMIYVTLRAVLACTFACHAQQQLFTGSRFSQRFCKLSDLFISSNLSDNPRLAAQNMVTLILLQQLMSI
jgi:hypothetical protein